MARQSSEKETWQKLISFSAFCLLPFYYFNNFYGKFY